MKSYKSYYYKIKAPNRVVHIHIDYDEKEKKIKNIFVRTPPIGDDINTLSALLATFISKYLQLNGTIENVMKHLNSAKGSSKIVDDGEIVENIPSAIVVALKKFKEEVFDKQ